MTHTKMFNHRVHCRHIPEAYDIPTFVYIYIDVFFYSELIYVHDVQKIHGRWLTKMVSSLTRGLINCSAFRILDSFLCPFLNAYFAQN